MAGVSVKFSANTSGFHRGIKTVQGAITGLAATVGAIMAPLVGLVGVGAALGGAFKGVKLAAEMEAAETAFATLLGSAESAKTVLSEISDLAASTPYGLEDLIQSGRSLLAITDKEKLTDTLRMIGDLASASQKPITELASMYAKIKGGDVVQGEDLNMIGDALGGGALQEFARVLGVDSVKAVRKLGSEGKITGSDLETVFRNLTSKGGMAFQAMEAQSRTFNGLISTLKDNFDALLREFGKPVMEALKPTLEEGITLLDSLKSKAREFGEVAGKSIVFFRNAFKNGELISLSTQGFTVAAQSFVNIVLRGMQAAGAVLMNAFVAIGEMLFAIFSNASMWDQLHAQFDVVGLKIQKAILEAIPENWLRNKNQSLGHIEGLIDSRSNAASNYGEAAARKNAEAFNRGADALKESGKVFSDGFKNAKSLFDTSRGMENLRARWQALTNIPTPAAVPSVPTKTATAFTSSPRAEEATRFSPILSSLARIGGASALTGNPLVALQQTANNHLARIERNTLRSAAILG